MKDRSKSQKQQSCFIFFIISMAIVLGFVLGALPSAIASTLGTWKATGSMATARYWYTATLLPNGKVLVAGGFYAPAPFPDAFIPSAELYDPSTGTFSPTGSMAAARCNHTATLLPDGKILITGGSYLDGPLSSAELYDPSTGTFASTGSMGTGRTFHTATLLPNGKVLIAGGRDFSDSSLSSAELYDPSTGTFTSTESMGTGRTGHTATLLPNGKVLVAGGFNIGGVYFSSAELYDPSTGTFAYTGSMGTARDLHTATLLPNGKVLIAGGRNSVYLSSAELYDPSTGTFAYTGSMGTARDMHIATLLLNGKVLVAGGCTAYSEPVGTYLSSAELYDPVTGIFNSVESMATVRYAPTATLLPDGKVLVAGGYNNGASIPSAELYQQTADINDFFETSVNDGSLRGVGPTAASANGKLGALRNMLENAESLIASGSMIQACRQLITAYNKTDGNPKPPDFVTGPSAAGLATIIQELMAVLGCN